MNLDQKGYIQIYTGNGKGKTTAALGVALRAAGHGINTYIAQFLKGQKYGELDSIRKFVPLITIEQFGRDAFIHIKAETQEQDIEKARQGLAACFEAMLSGKYQIIILDEINVALHFDLLEEKEIHRFLDQKPPQVEIILTGRYAPQSLVDRADLVTEMKEIKHYYSEGIKARKGIEK
jgi:cob(I)alamin adenosyltransferase